MIKKYVIAYALLISGFFNAVHAQNNRLNTYENVGWYNVFGTLKIDDKWGVHAEYQWRRDNTISDWQQSLLRLGVNYQLNPRVLLRVGYAWAETFAYGSIPINAFGKDFTEHRFFQMAQLSHKEGIVDISHRFMLEQRFVGRYSSPLLDTEDEYPFLNRMRYMVRFQIPLKGREMKDRTPYAAVYDEILIGFGKNVNANIFDQNRLGLLVGYRYDKTFRIEAGYINQILQFGRFIGGRPVFQHNSGPIVNAYFNF